MARQKAKCPENQEALDRLTAKREKVDPGKKDRYGVTLKRAWESLQQCPEPITTFQQALSLKYVGNHCASIICPPKKRRDAPSPASSADDDGGSSVSSSTAQPKKRARQAASTKPLETIHESNKPSSKERAYQKAVQESDAWKTTKGQLLWRVVLLIDGREPKSEHVIAKCQMSGIPCEERHLPIGDMAWVAQGFANNNGDDIMVTELLLGTIMERKTPEDLKSSIFGSRYLEQGLRLQNSGLPQVLFLMEGNLKDLYRCPADTLHTALWETRLHHGFCIVQTEHMEGTVQLLKRLHRRILQRTFPTAFTKHSALPVFQEAAKSNAAKIRGQRRIHSLAEMKFDVDPQLPLMMTRWISYPELKAKVERDREAGTKTVHSIHLAMLKQVPTFSDKKCQAVGNLYKTPRDLFAAYAEHDTTTTSTITDLATHDINKSQRNTTIGPKSANELYNIYGRNNDCFPMQRSAPVAAAAAVVAPPVAAAAAAAAPSDSSLEQAPPAAKYYPLVARVPKATTCDSSPELLDDDAQLAEAIQRSLQESSSSTQNVIKKMKNKLNTSITSLLMSSSSDDDTPVRKPAAKPVAAIDIDSSDDDDDEELPPLRERLKRQVIEID